MMKTVLQMIIDQFKDNEKVEFTGASVVHLLEMYLPNEKQQIMESHNKGQQRYNSGYNPTVSNQYYNETFNIK